MNKKSLVVIGAGRAGGSLVRLWHQSGIVAIKAVYSRSRASADELAKAVGASVVTDIAQIPDADFLLIATPDTSLNSVAMQLERELSPINANETSEAIAFHLSGACGAEELKPLQACGFKLASVHPLRSFASSNLPEFAETFCGIEGDEEASPKLKQLFEAIGGRCFNINDANKTAYHSASVLSSNAQFALADVALAAWGRAGVKPEMAREIYRSLAVETANNISKFGPKGALTGPVSRGDTAIVLRQIEELQLNDQLGAEIYRNLGLRLLALAGEKLDQETVMQLTTLLTSNDTDKEVT